MHTKHQLRILEVPASNLSPKTVNPDRSVSCCSSVPTSTVFYVRSRPSPSAFSILHRTIVILHSTHLAVENGIKQTLNLRTERLKMLILVCFIVLRIYVDCKGFILQVICLKSKEGVLQPRTTPPRLQPLFVFPKSYCLPCHCFAWKLKISLYNST
jgi:hypothetical protein